MSIKLPSKERRKLGELHLGRAYRLTNPKNSGYEKGFTEEIRKLRPDWFEGKVKLVKDELLKLAKSGADRPNTKSKNTNERKLGYKLCHYTSKKGECYDAEFNIEIRKLRPDWFEDTAKLTKYKLLKLAKSGADRPNGGSKNINERKLGNKLGSYMSKRSGNYDAEFDIEIRKLRPDWFENKVKLAKDELLKLAKSGADRPNGGSKNINERKLNHKLRKYTNKTGNYDAEFDIEIRKLRPDWFENKVKLAKDELLKLAKSGADRPNRRSKNIKERRLGVKLCGYISKSGGSYDTEFDAEIRKLRPDWFVKASFDKTLFCDRLPSMKGRV